MTTDPAADIAARVFATELGAGYISRGHLIDILGDALDAEGHETTKTAVTELVDRALAARQREEQSWDGLTDHDRLIAALDELDRSGIISRECYGATIKDAEHCVHDEAMRIAETTPVRGTCTFNIQDVEGASDGAVLYLSYASFATDDDAPIGEEVAAAMRRHGLEVEWSGETRHRIGVRVPDWRVRRSTGDRQRRTMQNCNDLWSTADE